MLLLNCLAWPLPGSCLTISANMYTQEPIFTAPPFRASRGDRGGGVAPRAHRHAPRQARQVQDLPQDLQAQVSHSSQLRDKINAQ